MLGNLNTFCTVVELGNLKRAAEKLQLSISVVSRRISSLEAYYNTKLLNRTTRMLSTTEAGEALYKYAKSITETFEESKSDIKKCTSIASGTLKVGLPTGINYTTIMNKLPAFLAQNPGINLHVFNGNYLLHLLNQGYNMVLNCGPLPNTDFYYRKIGEWQKVTCASPKYLAKHGAPKTPSTLTNHNCLTHYYEQEHIWNFKDGSKKIPVFAQGNVRINSSINLTQLATHDVGIVYLPHFVVANEINTGTLVPVLTKFQLDPLDLYAVYPSKKYLCKKTELFIEFLTDVLG
ncbi:MAG: LysR family transcriptional regulator [Gammaproteobacteria bacterium]|nr:LysR family transcriptional regulator [Gammaproteobacteria bacterium]